MSFKKFIVAADSHGELIHNESLSKLLGFCDTWKPHIRVDLGDVWDFAPLRGGASLNDQTRSISEDYQAGIRYLETFRPNLLTLGNHDSRIWEWIDEKLDDREMIESIIKSKSAVIRFEGNQYYNTRTISASQKQSMRDVLFAYDGLR